MPSLGKNDLEKVLDKVNKVQRRIKAKGIKINNRRKYTTQQNCERFHTSSQGILAG